MYLKLVIALAALAIAGGGTYAYVSQTKDMETPTEQSVSVESTTSLKTLLASGLSQVCTFTDVQAVAETSGTVYIADGKARGDFEAKTMGQTYHVHAIVEEETMYTWIDETKMAFALPLTGTSTSAQSFDATKNLAYACEPWTADAGKFEKPADVSFSAVSTTNVEVNACTACDAVPEAYRAQCKKVAGC